MLKIMLQHCRMAREIIVVLAVLLAIALSVVLTYLLILVCLPPGDGTDRPSLSSHKTTAFVASNTNNIIVTI